jgi:hypothetical protein
VTEPGRAWPQPYEGITGTDRCDDGLLGLSDTALTVRARFISLTRMLRSAVLVGDPAPVAQRIWQRMGEPRPGDLVVETSTIARNAGDFYKGFGFLIGHRTEWWHTDEQWQARLIQAQADHEVFLASVYARPGDPPEPPEAERPTDDAWYVQYGPSATDVCRWVNCDFITIPAPQDLAGGEQASGALTRPSLLGMLADSGFTLNEPPGAGTPP